MYWYKLPFSISYAFLYLKITGGGGGASVFGGSLLFVSLSSVNDIEIIINRNYKQDELVTSNKASNRKNPAMERDVLGRGKQ